jgi:signal transduction histidine kinase
LEYYRQSLDLKIRNNASHRSLSAAYNNIGISNKNLGRYDTAMYYYQLALQQAELSREVSAVFNPMMNIANLQKRTGNLEKSITTFGEILKIEPYLTAKQKNNVFTNLGILNNEVKDHQKAILFFDKALAITRESDNLIDLRDILSQLALSYAGLNNFQKAFETQAELILLNDSINQREGKELIADLVIKYESAEKDRAILESQQIIQAKEISLQKQNIKLITAVGLIILMLGFAFFLFKQKQAAARQAKTELMLARQEELTRINEERLRISRELHDNIGSYLTLISAGVEQLHDKSEEQMAEKIPELKSALSMSMRELRKTVWLLNKSKVSIDELIIRLRDFFKPATSSSLDILISSNGNTAMALSDVQTTHLFRILQEAVNNAIKHSDCTCIELSIISNTDENLVQFEVKDNGIGFELEYIAEGNGLRNMKDRIKSLKGEIHIETEKGNGCRIFGQFYIENKSLSNHNTHSFVSANKV